MIIQNCSYLVKQLHFQAELTRARDKQAIAHQAFIQANADEMETENVMAFSSGLLGSSIRAEHEWESRMVDDTGFFSLPYHWVMACISTEIEPNL